MLCRVDSRAQLSGRTQAPAHLIKCSEGHNDGSQGKAGCADPGDQTHFAQLLAPAPGADGEPEQFTSRLSQSAVAMRRGLWRPTCVQKCVHISRAEDFGAEN